MDVRTVYRIIALVLLVLQQCSAQTGEPVGGDDAIPEPEPVPVYSTAVPLVTDDWPAVTDQPAEGDIRLVGGVSEFEGRLEIYHESYWGTICDQQFDNIDAVVACRQLGYAGGFQAQSGRFETGVGPMWMSNIRCNGNANRLVECMHRGWGIHNCGHHEDVGVTCIPVIQTTGTPDLTTIATPDNTTGVSVSCGDKTMEVAILREFILYVDASLLTLRWKSCRPTQNDTHLTFSFDIGSCGTQIEETREEIIYKNTIRTPDVSQSAVIRRYPDISIPISCTYPKRLKVNFNDKYAIPTRYDSIHDEEHEEGQFVGEFKFYHGETFADPYPEDAVVEANYRDDVFFGINLKDDGGQMTRWKIRTDSCRGTSSSDPDDAEATGYTFLADGCSQDETLVRFENNERLRETFAIEAFRFRAREVGNLVYMHCNILVCDVNTTQSFCDEGCGDGEHEITRRNVRGSGVSTLRVSTGPLLIKSPEGALGESKKVGSKIPIIAIAVVSAVVTATVAAIGVVFYRRKRCGSMDVHQPY